MAFEGIDDVTWQDNLFIETVDDRDISWLRINNRKTILCVTPFLTNRYGLNSNKRIEKVGLRIREICDQELGTKWIPEELVAYVSK